MFLGNGRFEYEEFKMMLGTNHGKRGPLFWDISVLDYFGVKNVHRFVSFRILQFFTESFVKLFKCIDCGHGRVFRDNCYYIVTCYRKYI